MTHGHFNRIQQELFEEIFKLGQTKGKEYAHNDSDRLANFKRLAEGLELTPEQICWVYTRKHLEAIESFCKTNATYSGEPIQGRIMDAICYLTLLWGLISESSTSQDDLSKSEESSSS
jgi:hypothetical protein